MKDVWWRIAERCDVVDEKIRLLFKVGAGARKSDGRSGKSEFSARESGIGDSIIHSCSDSGILKMRMRRDGMESS